MVLKVRAGVPLVWRSPSSLQFGVGTPLVVLDDVDEATERLVTALVGGISQSGFEMMTRSLSRAGDPAEALLARLGPALETEHEAPTHRVVVSGDGELVDELRRVLDDEGVLAAPNESEPDLAVVVAGWVLSPEDHGSWLRRDIPHLPVVIGDDGVTVGPLVEPGSGPCLYCVQLTRTDDDPAWPAIATQLWNRRAPALNRLEIAEAAAFTARRALERLAEDRTNATSWRLGRELSSRVWTQHPECRCSAPAESGWAPAADRAARSATTRAAAAAVPV
jgi:hypothetical protein